MIAAIVGHRPGRPSMGGYNLPNPIYIYVCQEIDKLLRQLKPDKVISGMALGVNQWAANIAMKLNIPVLAAVPFEGQEKKWPPKSQNIYHKLINKCSEIVYVCPPGYTNRKMQLRNMWMVDQCDILIGVISITTLEGGTYNCVQYGKKMNKNIIIIDPSMCI